MITLMLAGLLTAMPAPAQVPGPSASAMRGAPGVCIRWEARRPNRVAEARIVQSSGNAELDRRVRERIPSMDWPIGVDDYRGQWVGVWLAVGGATAPEGPLPDCSGLPDRSWPAAPASGS